LGLIIFFIKIINNPHNLWTERHVALIKPCGIFNAPFSPLFPSTPRTDGRVALRRAKLGASSHQGKGKKGRSRARGLHRNPTSTASRPCVYRKNPDLGRKGCFGWNKVMVFVGGLSLMGAEGTLGMSPCFG